MGALYEECIRKACICHRCGRQDARTLIGKYYCFDCLEYQREASAKHYSKHHEGVRERQRKTVHRKREFGLCVRCGSRRPTEGRVTCERCLAKERKRQAENRRRVMIQSRESIRTMGICYLCCKGDVVEGRTLCADCLEKARGRIKELHKHRQKEN